MSVSESLRKAKLCELFKRYDKAEEVYMEIMQAHPADFRAYFNCAMLLTEQPDRGEHAILLLRKVLELDDTVIETYGALAALYIKLHNPTNAIQYCRAGLLRDSNDKTCLYNINVALRQVGAIEEAIELSWRCLEGKGASTLANDGMQGSSSDSSTNVELTIVCVKWGKKYDHAYVNNLFSALQRNMPAERTWKLVCFTDDTAGIDEGVECYPFAQETASWQGWWLKAHVFAPHAALTGWVLYIDLDTVICDSLAFIFDLLVPPTPADQSTPPYNSIESPQFYILSPDDFRNEARSGGMNSSLVLWNAAQPAFHALYHYLAAHYGSVLGVIYKFDHYLEMMLHVHTVTLSTPGLPDAVRRAEDCVDCSRDAASSQALPLEDSSSSTPVRSLVSFLLEDDPLQHSDLGAFCAYFQDRLPGRIIDYFALQKLQAEAIETGVDDVCPSIVCFPLRPKPHELLQDAWVSQHWHEHSGNKAECETTPVSRSEFDDP